MKKRLPIKSVYECNKMEYIYKGDNTKNDEYG